jgi:surface protein
LKNRSSFLKLLYTFGRNLTKNQTIMRKLLIVSLGILTLFPLGLFSLNQKKSIIESNPSLASVSGTLKNVSYNIIQPSDNINVSSPKKLLTKKLINKASVNNIDKYTSDKGIITSSIERDLSKKLSTTYTSDAFVTTWETTTTNEYIYFPFQGSSYGYTYNVDWGDGNNDWNHSSHSYATPGTYTVSVTGTFPNFSFSPSGNADKIRSVEQWGTNVWTSMRDAFFSTSNLAINATDAPDLSHINVNGLSGMFTYTTNVSVANIANWNISTINNMSLMFSHATGFTGDISGWDVSNVTNMAGMFDNSDFNQDISNWNVSNVLDMEFMFQKNTAFNQNLSLWNVSKVTNMSQMFDGATAFNQNIGLWDVSSVTDMSYMFQDAITFNQDLSPWNVSSVTNMWSMFQNANAFNQNLGEWDISNVTNMIDMFKDVTLSTNNYDNTLIGWDTLSAGETKIPTNITIRANNSHYCKSQAARTDLINTYGWFIGDGGMRCPFVSKWETTIANETITIPTTGSGYDYTVDWGDGSTSTAQTGNSSHSYASAGFHSISIYGTFTFPRIYFNNTGDKDKIIDIEQWGTIQWTSMGHAFEGCSNLTIISATDHLYLDNVTDMSYMFTSATNFNSDISDWDVSGVNNMSYMFYDATSFNQNLNSWNVWRVTDMSGMFLDARAFNGNISSWNTGNVTNMENMFENAIAFNGNISNWDVSSVTNMSGMFQNATAFNGNIGSWNVTYVTNMSFMFSNATNFNQNLNGWKVFGVTNMSGMFNNATAFNGDISNWDVSNVTNMSYMFEGATAFNGDINAWQVYRVTDMSYMFQDATAFNQNLNSWVVTNVTNMGHMFEFASAFNGNISSWHVWNVTNMSFMFSSATVFNSDIHLWNVRNATNMSGMFYSASVFNGDISNWNVSKVTNMSFMFSSATAFNRDLINWDVWLVTNMNGMFSGATAFNGDISNWDVSKVIDMHSMFSSATAFNRDLINWNVWHVTDMSYMFKNASAFNGYVSNWAVTNVTNMSNMFNGATAFNQDLEDWDISNVSDMSNMFTGVTLSTFNYDNTLFGWSNLVSPEAKIPRDIIFDGGNSKYSREVGLPGFTGLESRNILINDYNWAITDGGEDTSLGIDDFNKTSGLKLYPNPSSNIINIDGDMSGLKKIKIYSILGKCVMILNKNFKTINLASLSAGTYFVHLITNEGTKTIKFIKE